MGNPPMTLEIGPNAYRYLTESRPWVYWGFMVFFWAKIGIAIVLRPARMAMRRNDGQ
jgi:hypothetical protein